MKSSRESLGLALVCLVLIAASIWGIVAAFAARLELNVDGIMLICVCLLTAGIFSLMLFILAREQGWLPSRRKQEAAEAARAKQAAAAAAPSVQAAAQAKPAQPQSKSTPQEVR